MSANYGLVRESERELTRNLLKFYRHVKNNWKDLISSLSKNTTISNEEYQKFQKDENKSNRMEADILNECIWSISRNQPVANHLRFAVSIIYSISDLERMADYIINSVNIIRQNNFNKEAISIIRESFKLSYKCMSDLLKPLETKDKIKLDTVSSYKLANNVLNYYRVEYKKINKGLSKIMFDKNSAEQIEKFLSSISIIIKYSERNVDHAVNILDNFVYVRESDFIFSNHKNPSLDFDNLNLNPLQSLTKKEKIK